MSLKSMDRMPAVAMGVAESDTLDADEDSSHDGGSIFARGGISDVCGTPIFVGSKHESTLGGVLLINGKYYGMTSLHPRIDQVSEVENIFGEDGDLEFDDDSDIASISKFYRAANY
jgi:hypothetical protein